MHGGQEAAARVYIYIYSIYYLGLPEVDVGVAERGVEDLDTHLHGLWRRHLHLLDGQRLAGLPRHGGCRESKNQINPMIRLLASSHHERQR